MNTNASSTEMSRDLTLSLGPVTGSITMFYAFVNGMKVIQSDGTKKRTQTGKISNAQMKVKIKVTGIDDASFRLSVSALMAEGHHNL